MKPVMMVISGKEMDVIKLVKLKKDGYANKLAQE